MFHVVYKTITQTEANRIIKQSRKRLIQVNGEDSQDVNGSNGGDWSPGASFLKLNNDKKLDVSKKDSWKNRPEVDIFVTDNRANSEFIVVEESSSNSEDESDTTISECYSFPLREKQDRLACQSPYPTISKVDFKCLSDDEFINDTIISFYMKYLYKDLLSEEDRSRTYIFNSFFYSRLTFKVPTFDKEALNGKKATAAEIRHNRVKNWTKGVDIFSKDFVIIPINEDLHWALAIICFPHLHGPVPFSDETNSGNEGTTEPGGRPELGQTDKRWTRCNGATSRDRKDAIKQPCILLFDSLGASGIDKKRVISILRDYLRSEYVAKHKEERDFSPSLVKGICPKVPCQTNHTDCGLFLLQYAESFFSNRITDYREPIRLDTWFSQETVSRKRKDIRTLVLKLMREEDAKNLVCSDK